MIESIRLDLLDLLGSGYVIDHCVSAFLKEQREELYQIYVTDSLKAIGHLNRRFADYFNKPKKEERTAEEIIDGIKKKLGG